MTYKIKVAQFEGPFDLILFFIERDEVDIYDIPIAKLTNDFLDYIRQMDEMNIDLASEFILVAATLMQIKAKMLLPRKELDEQGEEIDPRAELVSKLLEYKKYKGVVDDLHKLATEREQMHVRGNATEEKHAIYDTFETEMDLESLNLYKLLKVFKRALDKMEKRNNQVKVEHRVVIYPYTITQQRKQILQIAVIDTWLNFEQVFESCHEKMEAVFRFLAMLEAVQLRMIKIRTNSQDVNQFEIIKTENADELDANVGVSKDDMDDLRELNNENKKDKVEKKEEVLAEKIIDDWHDDEMGSEILAKSGEEE